MKIKILGSGCSNCQTLEKRMAAALDELKVDATIEKVQSFQDIAAYGVMSTPALVINDKIVLQGQVPQVEALKEIVAKFDNAHAS
ncbi:MAG: thioredoxin family protein [Candidatus Kryptoniota bacterium]